MLGNRHATDFGTEFLYCDVKAVTVNILYIFFTLQMYLEGKCSSPVLLQGLKKQHYSTELDPIPG